MKRGGAEEIVSFELEVAEGRYRAEPAAETVPEMLYEKQWAVALIEQVFAGLRAEYTTAEKKALLEELKEFVWGEEKPASYGELGEKLNMTEGAVKE